MQRSCPERHNWRTFRKRPGVTCEYKHQRYFCSYSIEVTICVTGICASISTKTGAVRYRTGVRMPFSAVLDRSSRHVPETGRPSRSREDHHSGAVAAGDEGTERNQLPPGQRVSEAQLPH